MTQPRDDERIAHMVEVCEEGMAFVAGRRSGGPAEPPSTKALAGEPKLR